VDEAYRAWANHPTLAAFVEYLGVERAGYVDWVRQRARQAGPVPVGSEAPAVLEALLAHLQARGTPTIVLLPPQNPLLDEDVQGEYHRADALAAADDLVAATARRHGVGIVDGRRWMPADAFLDLDHLFPDQDAFQTRLATEVGRAVGS
jgi:hypothetical protein